MNYSDVPCISLCISGDLPLDILLMIESIYFFCGVNGIIFADMGVLSLVFGTHLPSI